MSSPASVSSLTLCCSLDELRDSPQLVLSIMTQFQNGGNDAEWMAIATQNEFELIHTVKDILLSCDMNSEASVYCAATNLLFVFASLLPEQTAAALVPESIFLGIPHDLELKEACNDAMTLIRLNLLRTILTHAPQYRQCEPENVSSLLDRVIPDLIYFFHVLTSSTEVKLASQECLVFVTSLLKTDSAKFVFNSITDSLSPLFKASVQYLLGAESTDMKLSRYSTFLHQLVQVATSSEFENSSSSVVINALLTPYIDQIIDITHKHLSQPHTDKWTRKGLAEILEWLIKLPAFESHKQNSHLRQLYESRLPADVSSLVASLQSLFVSPPLSDAENDETPLSFGSLTLPLRICDIDNLFAIEVVILARQREDKQNGVIGSPEVLQQQHHAELQKRIKSTIDMLATSGTEEEWAGVARAYDFGLMHGLTLALAYLPLSPEIYQGLVQSLWVLGNLFPKELTHIALTHPQTFEKLLRSIFSDLPNPELLSRLRLLSTLLEWCECETLTAIPQDALHEGMIELLDSLSNPQANIVALSTTNLLLLNSIDLSRRPLVTMLVEAQRALLEASSSSQSTSTRLTTNALSALSQEFIMLINAGRIPAGWEEEADELEEKDSWRQHEEQHASVTDMYASKRTKQKGEIDRVPCPPITTATLSLVCELFHTNTALDLFYTNDIYVLIDVIVRKLLDEQEQIALLLDHLLCLSSIITWSEYPKHNYRIEEINEVLNALHQMYEQSDSSASNDDEETKETKQAIHELLINMQKKVTHLLKG